MTISSNRLIELAITSDPTSALFGQTWSFPGGDLITTVDAALNAEVVGSAGVMQPGDTIDLDNNGTYEGTYQGRFNFTGSTFTLGDGTTISGAINIIEVTVGGTSQYYMIINDALAADLDGNDLSSVTFGTNFTTSPNVAGLNFDDANSYQLVCFAKGTHIATDGQDCLVEQLQVGDRVLTRDHGYQKIRWIGSRKVAGHGKFAPIVFQPGAVGNSRTLKLSRQHRVFFNGPIVELLFGCHSALAAAHSLVNDDNIFVEETPEVEYFHILFDRHEIIESDGAWTESFFPNAQVVDRQDKKVQEEIYTLFPDLTSDPASYGDTARMCLKPYEAQTLSYSMAMAA